MVENSKLNFCWLILLPPSCPFGPWSLTKSWAQFSVARIPQWTELWIYDCVRQILTPDAAECRLLRRMSGLLSELQVVGRCWFNSLWSRQMWWQDFPGYFSVRSCLRWYVAVDMMVASCRKPGVGEEGGDPIIEALPLMAPIIKILFLFNFLNLLQHWHCFFVSLFLPPASSSLKVTDHCFRHIITLSLESTAHLILSASTQSFYCWLTLPCICQIIFFCRSCCP